MSREQGHALSPGSGSQELVWNQRQPKALHDFKEHELGEFGLRQNIGKKNVVRPY